MILQGLKGDLIWSIKYIFVEYGKRKLFSSETLETGPLKRQVTYCMQALANKVTLNRLLIHLVFSSKLIFFISYAIEHLSVLEANPTYIFHLVLLSTVERHIPWMH